MEEDSGRPLIAHPRVRHGRPRRDFAGEVDKRILEAAGSVFLKRGFEGATIDQIAEAARSGKPTIYARFPSKEALFTAVLSREALKPARASIVASGTAEQRLRAVASALIEHSLEPRRVGLLRAVIGAAPRFPELAEKARRNLQQQGQDAVAEAMGELAASDETAALPAFTPGRLPTTGLRFTDLVVLPLLMRALLGEDPQALCAEAAPHIAQAVAFFLAACRIR